MADSRSSSPTTSFRSAHALAESWGAGAKSCLDQLGDVSGHTLGFLYVTEELAADFSSVLTFLRGATRIPHWVGASAPGVCALGAVYRDKPAISVLTAPFSKELFRLLPLMTEDLSPLAPLDGWVAKYRPVFGVAHADPRNRLGPELVSALAEDLEVYLVGGLVSGTNDGVLLSDAIGGQGISGVLFAPEIAVATGLSQGCAPIGPTHRIGDCDRNVVMELDGRLALDVFKADIGEVLARDLRRVGGFIHAALPVKGSDMGDYMVRNIMAVDPAKGWIAVGDKIETGDSLMFVRRDAEAARADLARMAQAVKRRLGAKPRGALYYSCTARGASLFGADDVEIRLLSEILGDIPLAGIYANGEICHNRLYGYTGVLTLFA